MGRFTDVVQTRVEIDGKDALNALGRLESNAHDLKAEMKSLKRETSLYERSLKKMNEYEVKIKGFEQLKKETEEAKKQADELFKKYQEDTKNLEINASSLHPEVLAEEQAYLKKLKEQAEALQKTYQENQATLSKTKLPTKAYENAKKKVEELKESADKYYLSQSALREVNKSIDEHREKLGVAGMTATQLRRQYKELKRQLDGMTEGTEEYAKVATKFREIDEALKNQQRNLRDTRTAWQKMRESMSGFFSMAGGVIGGELVLGAFQGITEKIMMSVDGAAKLSDQLSDIQKKSGLSQEKVAELNAEFSKIKTRTSSSDLREIAIVGGSLGFGKTKEELLGFVETMDKVVVALGDEFTGGAAEASRSLGGLQKLFKETKDMDPGEAISRIASGINALGNAGSATAPEVAEFTKRLGALGNMAPSIEETLGLGAALIELGLSADTAAGGITAVMLQAGKESKAFAQQMGITETQFKALLNTDPNKMFLQLAESFKGLSNEQVIKALDRMKVGSQEAIKVMGLLGNKTDFVVEKQKISAVEVAKNSSITGEFNLKMKNFAAQLDLAKKKINAFEAGLTKAMLPALTAGIEGFVFFLEVLKQLPKFLKENRGYIALLVTTLVAYNAQLILSKTNQTVLLGIQKLGIAQQKIENLLKAQQNAQSLVSQRNEIKETALKIKSNAVALIKATRLTAVTAAQWAYNAALNANPIGLVVVALAALVGGLIYAYDNSETFRNGINGLWSGMKELASISVDLFKAFLEWDFDKIVDQLGNAGARIGRAFSDGFHEEANKKREDEFVKNKEAQLERLRKGEYDVPDEYESEEDLALYEDSGYRSEEELREEKANQKGQAHAKKLGLGAKKGKSDTQKKYDKAVSDFQKFKNEIAEIERDAYEKSLEGEAKELAQVDKKYQDLFEKAAAHEDKMKALKKPELLAQAQAQSVKIAEQYEQEKSEIQKKYAEKLEQEREAFQLARDLAQMTDRQKELHEIDKHYEDLIAKAEKLGVDMVQIQEEWNQKSAEIDQKYADAELKRQEELTKKLADIEQEKQDIQNRKDTASAELDVLQAPDEMSAIDARIAQLAKLRDIELQNKELLEEEKALIREKYAQQEAELEREKALKVIEGLQTAAVLGKSLTSMQFEHELNQAEEAKNQKIAKLDEQYAQGEMSKQKYEQAKAGIEKKADKEKAKIQTKQAKAEKAWNLANAIMNTAASVAKLTWNPPQAILAGVMGAIQIAKIASQPIPKFAKGGVSAMIPPGPSHSDGGIGLVNNQTGEIIGEMEGGEPMMILSKDTYSNNKPLIDELIYNSLHRNGAPVVPNYQAVSQGMQFAKGAVINSVSDSSARIKNTEGEQGNKDLVLKQMLEKMKNIESILLSKKNIPFSKHEFLVWLSEEMGYAEELEDGNGI